MPKINTKQIDGYDSMTDAEKLAALENLEIPADLSEENLNLKRALSIANAEIEQNREKDDWTPTTQMYVPEIQSEVDALNKPFVAIGKEALDLEAAGFDYATALKLAEAVHNGDFETAAKFQQMHENNERAAHAAEIAEAEETAALRKLFGLR